MYDELIKRLREVEEMLKMAQFKEAAILIEQAANAILSKPCWIPVTERLPEILHTVIVSGRMKYEWETDFIRFVDVATYTEGEFFETFNDWYEGQDEFEITHWMPLPEPPEED